MFPIILAIEQQVNAGAIEVLKTVTALIGAA
jgi:hypothetical protein